MRLALFDGGRGRLYPGCADGKNVFAPGAKSSPV